MSDPDYLHPFVLPVDDRPIERHGPVELYPPDAAEPRPAVVIVHGGPSPEALRPRPREWPVYRGYPLVAAARGFVGAAIDHRLYDPAGYPLAAADVAAGIEVIRADPRVDGDRVALWFFSGGAMLMADWLRTPPPWLRCVAATYPLMAPFPGWPVDPRFLPAEAVAGAGALPIVLSRPGLEDPAIAATVDTFVAAATARAARLEIIDVPDGRHGFDHLDHTDQSRAAVERALTLVLAELS
ncbi:alpha/beta hydrolase [Sphaerisporangium corydalis]|uniref:Alpha/beta hydrolase n=1 Tax=Sphaerisporangium corydalis TaxID=1441875 RepID=A0ABV9EHE7_9ACTN|nr:alpha/beta hydrolase [Sphaerisporangium corydalis]